jgi:hypothetical protein
VAAQAELEEAELEEEPAELFLVSSRNTRGLLFLLLVAWVAQLALVELEVHPTMALVQLLEEQLERLEALVHSWMQALPARQI